MPRSCSRRGQVEPLAALAATVAVALGVGLAGAAAVDALPDGQDRRLAEPALDRGVEKLRAGAVAVPSQIDAVDEAAPDGYHLNATLATETRRWSEGPPAPEDADAADRAVPVKVGPGQVVPGRLHVEVWA